MDEQQAEFTPTAIDAEPNVAQFAESYASFNRIINGLQRQYLELKEEFTAQNDRLAETNRKLVEMTQKNLAATEFLNGILNSLGVGVIAVDQSGRITHFNPAASLLFGLPLEEPLGRPYRDIITPGTPIDANCLRAAETGRAVDSVERVINLADGARLHLSASTALLRDNEGRPAGAVEVLHDLTKLKRMEHELARLNTLAALGEMAATIAHEVRNPLAGIGGFAALLLRDLPDDDARRALVEKIMHGVESLNKTVTTLLNYSRFDEVNKEETNIEEFLHRTIEQFRRDNAERAAPLSIVVRGSVGSDGASSTVWIDPMLMRQLLFNLFQNALEACGESGRVEIGCERLSRQRATHLYGERLLLGLDDTVLETTVADSGPGIAPEHIDRIFAPFFTTKLDGNGLGLAVAWKIIKAHGGDLVADNRPEGGARFRILLPVKMDHVNREQGL
ncbi:MAG: ATP-binding protein [Candidatus Zixiibacteriota bacterium]